jgi:hypothetical protein
MHVTIGELMMLGATVYLVRKVIKARGRKVEFHLDEALLAFGCLLVGRVVAGHPIWAAFI